MDTSKVKVGQVNYTNSEKVKLNKLTITDNNCTHYTLDTNLTFSFLRPKQIMNSGCSDPWPYCTVNETWFIV